MPAVSFPQTNCRAGVSRGDITPPVGIYHRMWGAATHERATGVHRPLTATVLWLEPEGGDPSQALVVASLDHCLLDAGEIDLLRGSIAATTGVRPAQAQIALTHTHGAGLMSRSRAELPGGELIGSYLDGLAQQMGVLAAAAKSQSQPATIVYGTGSCGLATHRDFLDPATGQYVCGFDPDGPADQTLLVAKITPAGGEPLGAIVNYACHPTTLAWQNTLISPDYLGAMRETVERDLHAPCLFLQGASGDLGPREGFVGDIAVADRNGRQLGFAALAALEAIPSAGLDFTYSGPVVSGATIGTWQYEPRQPQPTIWQMLEFEVPLTYRPDLPTLAETQSQLAKWRSAEAAAIAAGDETQARDCHARVERLSRQLWKLSALPAGPAFPLRIVLARLGDAIWLLVPGEHYQSLQVALRERFPRQPLVIATIANGWQPGYIPPAATYGRGIYPEQIAVVSAGSAELLAATIAEQIANLLAPQ